MIFSTIFALNNS